MADNECVFCGDVIPEGRQVCPNCEARAGEVKYDSDEFFHRKKPTNADRIRAYSDDVIANKLFCLEYDAYTHSGKIHSQAWWLDWLKKPCGGSKL